MPTANERRVVRNSVFKRSNGQCECVHPEDVDAKKGRCTEHITREGCSFVNKDNVHGEKIDAGNVIAVCNSCYLKKHNRLVLV